MARLWEGSQTDAAIDPGDEDEIDEEEVVLDGTGAITITIEDDGEDVDFTVPSSEVDFDPCGCE